MKSVTIKSVTGHIVVAAILFAGVSEIGVLPARGQTASTASTASTGSAVSPTPVSPTPVSPTAGAAGMAPGTGAAVVPDVRTEKQKALAMQTERLFDMATELKVQVDKTNKNILSLKVVAKAEEIELLAKGMKAQAKR